MKVAWLIHCLFISCCISNVIYPTSVCFIGDVQADYDPLREPRTLMGTYTAINTTGIEIDEEMVDRTVHIYKHSYFSNHTGDVSPDQYLFKVKGIGESNGWALSETLPQIGATVTVFLTCFQDSLFDCGYNQWFWGYNKNTYNIPTVKVLSGDCKEEICLKNLTLQLKADSEIDPLNPSPGDYSKLDGEFNRTFDKATGRYQWINKRDSSFRWYYRVNQNHGQTTQNWVYGKNNADRIACAYGYVESPLFCTVYIYAGSDPNTGESFNPTLPRNKLGIPGDTTWKIGVCGPTSAPTSEPTISPLTMAPTETSSEPSMSPTVSYCDYNGQMINISDPVAKSCEFGYFGNNDIGYCLPDGQIGNWEIGCYKISFSDDFVGWDDEQWMVYSPGGVSGETVLSLDGSDSFRFIPEDPSLVEVIRSREQITWPLRVRATVEKRMNECNLWSIALGQAWPPRSAYSSRLAWSCLNSKQFSLYRETFRLFDNVCWNGDIDDTMQIIYTLKNNSAVPGTSVASSALDCASLRLQTTDILSQNPWQNAYLWFGSYGTAGVYAYDLEGKINKSIVGRFNWIGYTQFFSDFDGSMTNIWNENDIANKQIISVMNRGDTITSNGDLYQFSIPFSIRLGIKQPVMNGVFAHFVSLGGTEYIANTTDNIVQIVWTDYGKVRLAYTSENIYQTGMGNPDDCAWQVEDTAFEVMIDVDTEKIMITDQLCDGVLVAKHSLSVTQTVITLGFIDVDGYDLDDAIEFTNIEVYQLPLSYAGNVANQEILSDVVTNIDDIFRSSSPTIKPTQTPKSDENKCPDGCIRYYPDGCTQCFCTNGEYDLDSCTTNMCSDTKDRYCDLCETDSKPCDAGDDVIRDTDNLCEFKQCSDPQGASASSICIVMANIIGILMLLINAAV